MFTLEQLDNAYKNALLVVQFEGGFDTFTFRKGFEHEFILSDDEKKQILDYVESKIQQGSPQYQQIKSQIDQQEFLSTDYYCNPAPRKFVGAYAPVVYKTFAGLMAMSLQ